jgi:hypothetical protein
MLELLLLRQAERKLGVCRRIAEAMPDLRNPGWIRHDMLELVIARAFAGYKDGNDINRLRHDPDEVAVERSPESGDPLASQSTISRVENAPRRTEVARVTGALVDQFRVSVKPRKIEIFDIDDTFCVVHGGRQFAFWNAHHDERGFSPMHRDRHQACHAAYRQALAEDETGVARQEPLRARGGHGMGRKQRCRLYFRPCRQQRPKISVIY